MAFVRRTVYGVVAAVLAIALTGCSTDVLIWGPEGAQVIQTTEQLVADMTEGATSELMCTESVADLGGPGDWDGLSAGEPERFVPEYWDEQAALEPQWSINLEGLPEGVAPGDDFPGDVFYRETADGLCVIDVAWSTLVAEG